MQKKHPLFWRPGVLIQTASKQPSESLQSARQKFDEISGNAQDASLSILFHLAPRHSIFQSFIIFIQLKRVTLQLLHHHEMPRREKYGSTSAELSQILWVASLCVTRGTEERHGRRPSGNAFPKSANQKIKQKQNEFQMNEMIFCVSNCVANGH